MLGDARRSPREMVAAACSTRASTSSASPIPVVPKGQARIRVQLSAAHTPEKVDRAIDAFAHVGKRFGLVG